MERPIQTDDIVIDWRTVGAFMTNSHVVICPKTKEAALIDGAGEAPVLQEMMESHGVVPKYYLQTHAHLDHVAALGELKAWHDAPIVLHREEEMLYDNVAMQCRLFGLPALPNPPAVGQWIAEGDEIQVGALTAKVLETPGHTPGGVSFLFSGEWGQYIFSGDTLFAGSIGRVDLPGADPMAMKASLQRLLALPDETEVFTGHGPPTTIGAERRSNPYLHVL